MEQSTTRRPLTDQDVNTILDEARKYIDEVMKAKKDISEDWVKLVLVNGVLTHWLTKEHPDFKVVEKFFRYNSSTSYGDILEFLASNEDSAVDMVQRLQLQGGGAVRVHTDN